MVSSDSKPHEQPLIVDVFTASAHGDFHKLKTFVEQDGASVSVPDVNGYYALQWASLNNFHEIVHYLIQVLFFAWVLIMIWKLGIFRFLKEFKLILSSYAAIFLCVVDYESCWELFVFITSFWDPCVLKLIYLEGICGLC